MTLNIGVDVGGTFTDFVAKDSESGMSIYYKRPSTPADPHRAIVDGLSELLEQNNISPTSVNLLLHGTTVGTNALIQGRVGKVALVTTRGFRDLLEIGRQVRPKVYNIHEDFPAPIVPRDRRFEVPERMGADGKIHVELDEEYLKNLVPELVASGAECVVVCFLHSYVYPGHEDRAVDVLKKELPDNFYVVGSTEVYPEFREYERFMTTVLNGALLTVMAEYLNNLTKEISDLGVTVAPRISHSNGGLMSIEMARKMPVRASLSGPAAGVKAVVNAARKMKCGNIITLDVGGTSSDLTLIKDYKAAETAVQNIGGFPVRLPAIDVAAVGAGGGTIAWLDSDDLLKVGPISAGAVPGPACYNLGGVDATVTDAYVFLGRLNTTALLDGRMPIKSELATKAITDLAKSLNLEVTQAARGILQIATATVVKALRTVSIERGHDPTDFTLFAYGGAGPLLGIDVARDIGIQSVVVPSNPGMMCAEGLHHCDLMQDFVSSALFDLTPDAADGLADVCNGLERKIEDWFVQEGVQLTERNVDWTAELRYKGQNFELSLPLESGRIDAATIQRLHEDFHQSHKVSYGFCSPSEPMEIVNVKAKAIQGGADQEFRKVGSKPTAEPKSARDVIFDSEEITSTPIYRRSNLGVGHRLAGPAIIEQQDTTILIYPGDYGEVDRWGNLIISLGKEDRL